MQPNQPYGLVQSISHTPFHYSSATPGPPWTPPSWRCLARDALLKCAARSQDACPQGYQRKGSCSSFTLAHHRLLASVARQEGGCIRSACGQFAFAKISVAFPKKIAPGLLPGMGTQISVPSLGYEAAKHARPLR